MKMLKKCHRSTVFLREWPFFWRKLDLRAACFLENGRFLHESDNFSVRNRKKKGIILTFLAQIIVYFDRIDVFDQIWAWPQGVFDKIFEKIDIRAQRFWKNGRFFDKIWAWSSVLLENGRFFFCWKYMGIRANLFRQISEKRTSYSLSWS